MEKNKFPFNVRVEKCSKPGNYYKSYIGLVLEVYDEYADWWIVKPFGESILKSDCTIIEEKEMTIMEKWGKMWEIKKPTKENYAVYINPMPNGKYAILWNDNSMGFYSDVDVSKFRSTPPIKYGYVRIDGDRITGIVTTMEDIKANPRNGYIVIELNDLTEQNKSA